MNLRALEPHDLPALRTLCAAPEVNRFFMLEADAPLTAFENLLGAPSGSRVAVGAFRDATLVAAGGMAALERPRLRHRARTWIVAGPQEAEACALLLAALRDTGREWWNVDRIDLTLPTGWPHQALLPGLGFAPEVVRRSDVIHAGEALDTLESAWIREGVSGTERAPVAERPASAFPRPALSVREAVPSDAANFARVLANPQVLWGTLQLPFTPVELWKGRFATNDPAGHRRFVAEVDGEVVGQAGLHGMTEPKRQHVWSLGMAVADAWQGRGVGQALMERLIGAAEELRVVRLELEVYADNHRASALYERSGFVCEGVKRLEAFRAGAYVDALVMARIGSVS